MAGVWCHAYHCKKHPHNGKQYQESMFVDCCEAIPSIVGLLSHWDDVEVEVKMRCANFVGEWVADETNQCNTPIEP